MFSLKGAKEWASGFLSDAASTTRPNLEEFLQEVSTENTEHLFFQKAVDDKLAMQNECKPSYEQLSQNSILVEANRNLAVLRAFDVILQERMQSYERFVTGLSKISSTFESFHDTEGTLRQAYDALFVYVEQELQQARQQRILADLRRQVLEVQDESKQKLTEYAREIQNLAKDVAASEKKLSKSKEVLNKLIESKGKIDVKDAARKAKEDEIGGAGAHDDYDYDSSSAPRFGAADPHKKKMGGVSQILGFGSIDDKVQHIKSDMRAEKRRELMDQLGRAERDVADDIRALLRAIGNQDQMQVGLRRAYQHVDARCKGVIQMVLRSMLNREEDSLQAKTETLSKFTVAVQNVDVDNDISEYITQHAVDDVDSNGGGLVLSAQALNILEDITPYSVSLKKKKHSSGSTSSGGGGDTGDSSESTAEDSPSRGYERDRSSTQDNNNVHDRDSAVYNDTKVKEDCMIHLTRLFYAGVGNGSNSEDTESVREQRKSIFSASISSLLKLEVAGLIDADDKEGGSERSSMSYATADGNGGEQSTTPITGSPQVTISKRLASDDSLPGADANKGRFQMPSANAFSKMNSLPNPSPLQVLEHCRGVSSSATLEEKMAALGKASVESSVCWLADCVNTQYGRDCFVTSLNQFRSRKVDVGAAYFALAAVLWKTLDCCSEANDIHTSKVIMMLSQTFYRMNSLTVLAQTPKKKRGSRGGRGSTPTPTGGDGTRNEGSSDSENDESEISGRGYGVRQYLKDLLTAHSIWNDGKFWEQVLWECAIEQLYAMPMDEPWHNLAPPDRREAVRRVHNVVMSQVMAVEHSMLELGCSHGLVREFVYRMCVIHQLTESQRHTLLAHLQASSSDVESV